MSRIWQIFSAMAVAALIGSGSVVDRAAAEGGPEERADPLSDLLRTPGVAIPAGVKIEWRVDNPFRFFNNTHDTEVHRATWISLTPEQRLTPVLSAERALSARHPDGWAAAVEGKPCWNSSANRYVCADGRPYVNPESHRIQAELKDFPDADQHTCTWLTAPRGTREGRGTAIKQSCAKMVEVQAPYPGGLNLTVEIDGVEIAESEVRVRDVMIVGMGDSFGSGEGNPDMPVRFSRERAADYGKR